MTKLFRSAPDGRYLGFILADRPIEEYADRSDLTADQPPDAPDGYCACLVQGCWVLQLDPPRPAPPTPPLRAVPAQVEVVEHSATCTCTQTPLEKP